MFAFLVKKTFFDMWDNMFRVLLMNLGFLAVLAILFLLVPLASAVIPLAVALAALGVAALAVYTGAVSRMCSDIADYKQPGFADFWTFLKDSAASSLLMALVLGVYAGVVFLVAMPFYASVKNLASLAAFALLFWVTVAVAPGGTILPPPARSGGQEVAQDPAKELPAAFGQPRAQPRAFRRRPAHPRDLGLYRLSPSRDPRRCSCGGTPPSSCGCTSTTTLSRIPGRTVGRSPGTRCSWRTGSAWASGH